MRITWRGLRMLVFSWLWLMGGVVLGYLVLFGCAVVIFVRGVVAAVVRLVR